VNCFPEFFSWFRKLSSLRRGFGEFLNYSWSIKNIGNFQFVELVSEVRKVL
jgi:hypothetical protein